MHWTYSLHEPGSDLQQGDFLAPTSELKQILNEVNPYFSADKYIGFVITTQTCDLVRHNRKSPKAQYINIATVRSLKEVSTRLLEKVVKPVGKGLFRKSDQEDAQNFLHRLFNQNEQAHGLFYLHPDADIELGDPSVAFLRIVITLKAEKYNSLISARKGRLRPDFQAKFGWLVGNLYSRAATPDWSDQIGGDDVLSQLVKSYLDERIPGHGPVWLDDVLINAGQENKVVFSNRDTTELIEELEKYRPPPVLDMLASEIVEVAKKALIPHPQLLIENSEAFEKTEEKILKLFEDKLIQYSKSANVELDDIHDEIKSAINDLKVRSFDLIAVNESKLKTLSNRLKINGKIKKLIK